MEKTQIVHTCHGKYGSEKFRANARRLADTAKARKAALTHCKHGHPFAGDNLRIDRNGYRICLTCHRATNRKVKFSGKISESKIREVLDALREGKTLRNIEGRNGDKYVGGKIISSHHLKLFCNLQPKIGRLIYKLAGRNARAKQTAVHSRTTAAPTIMRNSGRDAFVAVNEATKGLLPELRDVIRTDMFIDIAEGRLKPSDATSLVHNYVRKYYRDNSHSVMSRFGDRSIDAAMNADGFTLMDSLEQGAGWAVPIHTGRRVGVRRSGT